ncbi:MAG: polysaccharide deacetylase family protein [Bdellovibrionales bacterium]|nr:polysaccharide deacetylase family protein [Bdellovibrionales bacterium]
MPKLFLMLLLTPHLYGARVAVTIDDFAMRNGTALSLVQRDKRILAALEKYHIKAAAFVTGKYIQTPQVMERLGKWDKSGHLIANHTFSHPNFHKTELRVFEQDILKCEALIGKFVNFTRLFRFPYLKAGDTREKRDGIRRFLEKHGYKYGHVTIDASDWYISSRLESKLDRTANTPLEPYKRYYLDHIWERAQYYNGLSTRYLGREIDHTLLIHHNLLNALFLDDLLGMFREKGWELIDAAVAFKDPVFDSKPNVLPAGESLLWSLAKAKGDGSLRQPGEDSVYEKHRMDERQL